MNVKGVDVKTAFVLAGGRGERLKPMTDSTPKPLLDVKGKAILDYNIGQLKCCGIERVVLGVGYMAAQIMAYYGRGDALGLDIDYSFEAKPLGTGGALKQAARLLDERFLMLNGDNLMDVDYGKMVAAHAAAREYGLTAGEGSDATAALTAEKGQGAAAGKVRGAAATIAVVEVADATGFGLVELEGDRVTAFTEKPSEPRAGFINAGAYVLEKSVLDYLPNGFSLIEKTAFPVLAEKGTLYAFRHAGQWFPTDDLERLETARKEWVGKA